MRRREAEEKWRKICKGWEKSKLSQSAYCEMMGVKEGTFKYQLSKMRGVGKSKRFLPVRIEVAKNDEELSQPYCTIKFSGKGRVVIESDHVLQALKHLMQGTR